MMLPAINVEDFERKYVNDIYEKLARSFVTSSTNPANGLRHKRWDKVDEFLQSFPPGSVIADLGFGDGKYLQVHDGFTIGVEKCKLLCEKVSSNRNEVIVADITRLPFRRQFFDGLVCVGVIHHLATRRRRSKALHEMARILSLGGKVFLSVWGIEATFEELGNCDVLVPIRRNNLREKICIAEDENQEYSRKKLFCFMRSELNTLKNKLINKVFQDREPCHDNSRVNLSEKNEENIYNSNIMDTNRDQRCSLTKENAKVYEEDHRYYHVFTQKEFVELILTTKRFQILDTYHDKNSWVFILSRK